MSDLTLVKTRLRAGVWEGELHVPPGHEAQPDIEVSCLDQQVPGHELRADPDRAGVWLFRFAIPSGLVSDGVQTFLFTDRATGDRLGSFSLIAGEAAADDLLAEMALLRQELDLLKRAFRRHCVETGGT
ncbi:hypothetical protein [Celeribacter indicus]|uniref:Uncharacterized protein n=1 Tax=Celeribacter indicus TaxID=1208324 RepID=A0A0B5DQ52_9RHOB|nr:hypothetical protein [Celeribacter indicus]AJE45259.1 hypothetical protein P73_0544 [Celeribacter indicus]SDX21336.1 hypothetical protein SAMN05443573_11783 [Celeribacter indicus]